MKVVVLNGPNLDRLGQRQPEIYGTTTLAELEAMLRARAAELGAEVTFVQSADPQTLIDALAGADAAVINPASLTHHSVPLREAIARASIPVYEVHISNIHAREPYRRRSLIAGVVRGSIIGLGVHGYLCALEAAVREAKR